MMFFSHKIKFKKESESLGLNLNDKYIKKSKQELISLTQKHQQVDESLKKKRIQFQTQKNKLIAEHQFLVAEQKRHKLKIIKLEVRKDQLLAKKNPHIAHQKAEILKKYLKCMIYTIGDRYDIIKSLGNTTTYEFIKTRILNLEHKIYFKLKMKEVVFMKKLQFEDQKIMLVIKQKQIPNHKITSQIEGVSNKSKTAKSIFNPSKFNPVSEGQLSMKRIYEVKIFALTGKKFQFTKTYQENQLSYYIDQLSEEKKSQMFDTTKKLPVHSEHRKPRLSLEFNSVFKKSLQGFFFKRSSLTTNELNNKLVNIEEWLKESKNSENSAIDSSDHSRSEHNRSLNESIQDKDQNNQSAVSKASSIISRITQITKNKDKIIRRHDKHDKQQKHEKHEKNQKHENSESNRSKQEKTGNANKNLFATFKPESQHQIIKINPVVLQPQKSNTSSNNQNNEDSEVSNNNTSKPSTESTYNNGFLRSFIHGQKILLPEFNPLLNIVIIKKKKTFDFLPEYLDKAWNFNMVTFCVKKFQLKIQLQKQVRKSLLYKIIKLDNFFQTQNNAMEPFSLNVLFSVKYAKNDIYILKTQEMKENIRLGKQIVVHEYIKNRHGQTLNPNENDVKGFNFQDIVITCENIYCEQKQRTFLVHQILKEQTEIEMNSRMYQMLNGSNSPTNRGKNRPGSEKKKKNQLKVQQGQNTKRQRKRSRKKNFTKITQDKIQDIKEEQERKQQFFRQQIQKLFNNFVESNLLSIKEYRFMRKINFEDNLDKVIMIQKNMKCFYYRKKYKKMIKNPCIFKFEPNTKILITAIHDTSSQQIKIFTECILLRLNQKYKSYPIIYKQKYWSTISSALTNLVRLSESIIEIKDELEKYLQKKVRIYEMEQARLEALKPELYLNRLRRFFINIMLRVKTKRNIIYLKKLYQNSETYILMIRKSSILKNVCQANLYHLEDFVEKQQNKENLNDMENESAYVDQIDERTHKSIKNINQKGRNKRNKSRYQTINLLVDYFANIPKQKIPEEFYFDNQHFLLKPPKSPSVYYIERILMIDINSQEIAKEVAMIQWQQPSKKKKNYDMISFLNLDGNDKNNLNGTSLRMSEANTNKGSDMNEEKKFRVRKQKDSIVLPEANQGLETQNRLKLNQSRKSFRVSGNSKAKLPEERSRRSRQNTKGRNSKQHRPSAAGTESSNKLSSANRISRNSFYDMFNNSYNTKKTQYEITGNGHGNLLYYSLVKVEEVFYELHIYIVKRKFIVKKSDDPYLTLDIKEQKLDGNGKKLGEKKALVEKVSYNCEEETEVSEEMNYLKKNAFTDELFLISKENLSKKELLEANWTFIYNKIARWIKNNENLLVLVEQKF